MRCLSIIGFFATVVSAATFGADVAPDFSLTDVSYSSPRRNTSVSPRDYLLQVSAWYFGDAT